MIKNLREISGIELQKFPLEINKVGDLIYFEGTLMGVYKDINNSAYIFDWVEANQEFNRWLVYQVDLLLLADYIFGHTTHFNLINNPHKDLLFLIDKDSKGEIKKCKIVSPKNIPYDYLPNNTIYFDDEDAINLDEIIETFQLKNHNNPNNIALKKYDILEEAKKNESELINLHIKSTTSNVGFGKIRTSILGEILTNYQKLNEATAINIFDEKRNLLKDEKIRRNRGELRHIKELGETEFIYAKAASFSVFLKPIKQVIDLFDNTTSSEKITKKIFNLFEVSTDKSSIKKLKLSFDDGMLNSYGNLLREIKEQDIILSVSYANPETKFKLEETFDSKKAISILNNLAVLEISKPEPIKVKGVFKALDTLNNSFKFETFNNEIYIGKFSDQLKLGVNLLNLKDVYQTTIEIREIKKSSKTNTQEKINMVSCLIIN